MEVALSEPWALVLAVLTGGLGTALVQWLRGRSKDGADTALVITEAAQAAVVMARAESAQFREELIAARAEMAELRREMGALQVEVHSLRGSVAGLEAEREQLLRALARWQPETGTLG